MMFVVVTGWLRVMRDSTPAVMTQRSPFSTMLRSRSSSMEDSKSSSVVSALLAQIGVTPQRSIIWRTVDWLGDIA